MLWKGCSTCVAMMQLWKNPAVRKLGILNLGRHVAQVVLVPSNGVPGGVERLQRHCHPRTFQVHQKVNGCKGGILPRRQWAHMHCIPGIRHNSMLQPIPTSLVLKWRPRESSKQTIEKCSRLLFRSRRTAFAFGIAPFTNTLPTKKGSHHLGSKYSVGCVVKKNDNAMAKLCSIFIKSFFLKKINGHS